MAHFSICQLWHSQASWLMTYLGVLRRDDVCHDRSNRFTRPHAFGSSDDPSGLAGGIEDVGHIAQPWHLPTSNLPCAPVAAAVELAGLTKCANEESQNPRCSFQVYRVLCFKHAKGSRRNVQSFIHGFSQDTPITSSPSGITAWFLTTVLQNSWQGRGYRRPSHRHLWTHLLPRISYWFTISWTSQSQTGPRCLFEQRYLVRCLWGVCCLTVTWRPFKC